MKHKAILIKEVQTEEEFVELIERHPYAALFFSGAYCKGCVAYHPIIEDVAQQMYEQWVEDGSKYNCDDFIFLIISVDLTPIIARNYKVTSLPTTIALLEESILDTHAGVMDSDELCVFLESNWELI